VSQDQLSQDEELLLNHAFAKALEATPTGVPPTEFDRVLSGPAADALGTLTRRGLLAVTGAGIYYLTLRAMLLRRAEFGEALAALDGVLDMGLSVLRDAKTDKSLNVGDLTQALVGRFPSLGHTAVQVQFGWALFGLGEGPPGIRDWPRVARVKNWDQREPRVVSFEPMLFKVTGFDALLALQEQTLAKYQERISQHQGKIAMATIPDPGERVLRALYEYRVRAADVPDGLQHVEGYYLAKSSGLTPEVINDGIDLLEKRGLVRALRASGAGPYVFVEAFLTAEGRAHYMQAKREEDMAQEAKPADPRSVFVIHGRDGKAREAMFSFLRALDLKPIEWDAAVAMTGEASPYIGRVLEVAFKQAQAVVALFTGDEMASLRPELLGEGEAPEPPRPQPRANVLLEAGMALGSHPDRTLFVHVGELRSLSDLQGRHVVNVRKGRPWRDEIADRLTTAKCAVDTKNHRDWQKAGAELEESGAIEHRPAPDKGQQLVVAAQPAGATAPAVPKTDPELLHLFRLDTKAKLRASGELTLDLTTVRATNQEWSALPPELLANELHRMSSESLATIASQVGNIFELRGPPPGPAISILPRRRGW
jgi:predicted nucleotide-binding protein